MNVSRNLLSLWMSNLRLLYRHLGFDALWPFMVLFCIAYVRYQKYDTENVNLEESISLVILLLVFLEPLITNVVQGMFRYATAIHCWGRRPGLRHCHEQPDDTGREQPGDRYDYVGHMGERGLFLAAQPIPV